MGTIVSTQQVTTPDALRWDTVARIEQFTIQLNRLKEQYRLLPITDIAGAACLTDTIETLLRRRCTRELVLSNLQGREGQVSLNVITTASPVNIDD